MIKPLLTDSELTAVSETTPESIKMQACEEQLRSKWNYFSLELINKFNDCTVLLKMVYVYTLGWLQWLIHLSVGFLLRGLKLVYGYSTLYAYV